MHGDGSNQINLTNDPGSGLLAAWSPDRTKIAFVTSRDGTFEVYTMTRTALIQLILRTTLRKTVTGRGHQTER